MLSYWFILTACKILLPPALFFSSSPILFPGMFQGSVWQILRCLRCLRIFILVSHFKGWIRQYKILPSEFFPFNAMKTSPQSYFASGVPIGKNLNHLILWSLCSCSHHALNFSFCLRCSGISRQCV